MPWIGLNADKLKGVTERDNVANTMSGITDGAVVQAGTIQQVVLSAQAKRDAMSIPRQLPPGGRAFHQ